MQYSLPRKEEKEKKKGRGISFSSFFYLGILALGTEQKIAVWILARV